MIKAVLFDLDNTLVNFWRMKTMSMEAAMFAMKDAGLRMSKAKIERIFEDLYKKHGTEYDFIFQEFVKKAVGKMDWKILAHAVVGYRKMKNSLLEPYPGAMRTLLSLRDEGVKVGIVSDAPKMRGWLRLVSLKLEPFFDTAVFFDDTGKLKPHKAPFLKALGKLKVKPADAMMVGDHLERDIVGAKRLGMKACFAKYGHIENWGGKVVKKYKPDFEARHVDEIVDIVRKVNNQ